MRERWQAPIAADPYYNPNLSLAHDDFRLAVPPRSVKPWLKRCGSAHGEFRRRPRAAHRDAVDRGRGIARPARERRVGARPARTEEHKPELQSLIRTPNAVVSMNTKKQ